MNKILQPILEKYNLEYVETIRKSDGGIARSYLVILENSYGAKFSLKLFDSKDENAKKRFLNEIAFIRSVRQRLKPRYKDWMPNIKWYSKSGEKPYYIYSYIQGEPIGRFISDFGIKWGQFKHKNFYEFIGFFDAISNLDPSENGIEVGSWGTRTARKELQFYFENVEGLLPFEDYDKVLSFVDKNMNKAFKYKSLSHRDLYPENILLKTAGSRKFKFLDWEYLSNVPIGFDAAFLYLLFWREEYWKAKVLSYYYTKYEADPRSDILGAFTTSFRFCLILLAVRFIYQMRAFADRDNEGYEDAYLSFLYDLQSAASGEIVKPQNIKFFINMKDIQSVAAEYGIGKVKKYEIFYASKGNTVAKVSTTEGCYIFRFYSQSRSKSLILRELGIFEKLSDNGIKTYDVIRTASNELYLEKKLYGKPRKLAVLTYLTGSKIKHHWSNEKSAQEVGRTLRRIHDCNIIHGDFSKENVLFTKSKVTGVIDFEWGRVTNSRAAKFNDMAKSIALWLIDVRNRQLPETDFIIEFLNGYYKSPRSAQQLEIILDLVISKIEMEKSIFLTTVDKRRTNGRKNIVKRFDDAIEKVNRLKSSDIN